MIIKQKHVKKFAISALAAAVTFGLAGCSSDNPDSGSSNQSGTVSGTVVDGYLVGATVYLDINDNGRKNVGEPYAITDRDGSFSTSKDGTIDYCAASATAIQQRHCLRATSTGTEVTLRSYGGFDRLTGEPFIGTLSTRVTTVAGGAVADQMISPLTSMLMEVSIEDQDELLDLYGLTAEDLEEDFLDEDKFNDETLNAPNALNAALSFHKVVTIFSSVLDDYYDAFGSENNFPVDSSGLVYQALAARIVADDKLDETNLDDAFDAAVTAIISLYANKDLDLPNGGAAIASGVRTTALANAKKALDLIDDIIPSDTDFDDVNARALAVELVVQKMNDGADDDDVEETIALATDLESELTALLDGDVDFKGLVDEDLSGEIDFEDYAIPEGAAQFTALVGKQLKVSYEDVERNGDAYFFFNALDGSDTTAGTLNTCIRYEEEVDDSDEETAGSYLDATWFTIDGTRLVVTFGDGAYNITVTSMGSTEGGDKFSLSYGGETRTWISEDGFLGADDGGAAEEPTDDLSCEALFNPVE